MSTYNATYPSVQRHKDKYNAPRKVLRVRPEQIKEMREKHGWTQEALAKMLLVDVGTVSRWERGLSPPSRKYHMVLRRWAGLPEPLKEQK